MNPKRTIMVTWLAMLGIQTVGSIDSKHRLPSPKQYVAVGTLWSVLFLVGETQWRRTAAQLSVLVLLTATVLGPFGKRLIQFFNVVATNFAVPPASEPLIPGSQPAQPSGPQPTQPTTTSV